MEEPPKVVAPKKKRRKRRKKPKPVVPKKGTGKRGPDKKKRKRRRVVKPPPKRLSEEAVRGIWACIQEGVMTQEAIAERFGCNQENVAHIKSGRRQNRITGLPKLTEDSPVGAHEGVWGRPRKNATKRLKRGDVKMTRKVGKYLTAVAVTAILSKEARVRFKLPETYSFPKYFPRTIFNLGECTYEMSAKILLRWLYNNGYSDKNMWELGAMKKKIYGTI